MQNLRRDEQFDSAVVRAVAEKAARIFCHVFKVGAAARPRPSKKVLQERGAHSDELQILSQCATTLRVRSVRGSDAMKNTQAISATW